MQLNVKNDIHTYVDIYVLIDILFLKSDLDHMSSYTKLDEQNSDKDSSCTDFYEYICGSWDEANSLFHTKWSTKDFTQYKTFFYIRCTYLFLY